MIPIRQHVDDAGYRPPSPLPRPPLAGCLTYASETTVHEDGALETQGYVEFGELLHAGLEEEECQADGYDSAVGRLVDDLEQDGWHDVGVRQIDNAYHEDASYDFTTGTTEC